MDFDNLVTAFGYSLSIYMLFIWFPIFWVVIFYCAIGFNKLEAGMYVKK